LIGKQKSKKTCAKGVRGANQSFDQLASKKQKRTCARGLRGADWLFD